MISTSIKNDFVGLNAEAGCDSSSSCEGAVYDGTWWVSSGELYI
jgi:hypothetical protein